MNKAKKAAEAKERGNKAMQGNRPMEAILYYTEAIKWTPEDFRLYSNRSLAYLKMEQHYLAIEDANQVIELQPEWSKGYFRKAEVFTGVEYYEAALQTYKYALTKDPNDEKLQKAVAKADKVYQRTSREDFRRPFKGIGIGAIIGITFVLLEFLLFSSTKMEPYLVKGLFLAMFIGGGFGATQMYQYFMNTYRNALLAPPRSIPEENSSSMGTQTVNSSTSTETGHTKSRTINPEDVWKDQSSSKTQSSNTPTKKDLESDGVRQRAKKEETE